MRFAESAAISAGSSTTLPARDVDQDGRRLHRGQRLRADQPLGLRRERAGERDEVGLRQQLEQAVRAGTPRRQRRRRSTASRLVAITRMPNALRQRSQPRADAAEPDDQQRLAAEFVLALARGPRSCRASAAWPGCRAPGGAAAAGPGSAPSRARATASRIHALRARQPDAGGRERVAGILVGAGADRLDEGEPRRPRDELVAPHHRDTTARRHSPSARRELVERCATSKVPDAGRRAARTVPPCDRRRGQSRW